MQIRDAVLEDAAELRWVARASLETAYQDAVSQAAIDTAVENWYDEESLEAAIEDETTHIKVAEGDDQILGFIEFSASSPAEECQIQWIDVDPEHWEEGIGDALLEAAEAELFDQGVTRIEGTGLAANTDIIQFYEDHGYVEGAARQTDIGGETFTERSYLKFSAEEEVHLMEGRETDAGTFFIALDEHKVGSKGDFYVAYRDEDREVKYGFYCDSCGSVNASMDSMGRVQCNDCGSTAKPTRWDAAYL